MSALPASEHDRPSTSGTWLMAAVVLLIGFLITSGYGRAMGELAFVAFKQIARAQYELHQASQNLNADGQAEFAVLMKSNTAKRDLKAFLATRDGWDARPASIRKINEKKKTREKKRKKTKKNNQKNKKKTKKIDNQNIKRH